MRRAFAGVTPADLDPFVHMDQMGEVEYGVGEPKGTAWHPHRGFETFTYLMDGTFIHQDSHGGGGVIENGGTQYMTAGSRHPAHRDATGVAGHVRRPVPRHPAVDQPAAAKKWLAPTYQGLEGTDVTLVASADGGALVRILAGTVAGHTGPGRSQSPISIVHATAGPRGPPGAALAGRLQRAGVRPVRARSRGSADHPIQGGQLAVLGSGDHITRAGRARPVAGHPGARGPAARRRPAARAGLRVRALRDEHRPRSSRPSRTTRPAGSGSHPRGRDHAAPRLSRHRPRERAPHPPARRGTPLGAADAG